MYNPTKTNAGCPAAKQNTSQLVSIIVMNATIRFKSRWPSNLKIANSKLSKAKAQTKLANAGS